MENLTSKVSIGLLEGKTNWSTWKYKISILLRSVDRATDVVEGKLKKPVYQEGASASEAGDAAAITYRSELSTFIKADTSALLLLTTNLKEDILKNVMRFTTARDVWLELHRLYDGISEDRSYNLCIDFFSYKRNINDDIATHLAKLKNIWSELNKEISIDLPDLLLICKVLDTLSEEYFSFRSSWLLIPKAERTINNLTSHLCAFERAISSNRNVKDEDILISASTSTQKYKKIDKKLKCNYCLQTGHRVRNCGKWIHDGKPPKSMNPSNFTSSNQSDANITLMAIQASAVDNFQVKKNKENWWVDNGATSHVTNTSDLFHTFEYFDEMSTVTTANGDKIQARGKGSVVIEANVSGKKVPITLQDVWYVPSIQRNLFSVLAAHDKNPQSTFSSTPTHCSMVIDGETKLIGKRCQKGGLYQLVVKNVKPEKNLDVFMTTDTQLYHERLAHQNKRHVRAIVKRELGINLSNEHDLCEGCINGKAHRLKFGTRARASTPGELVHADVCGPLPYTYSKYRYFLLLKDDYSKFRSIYLLKEKSEVPEKLTIFLAEAKKVGRNIQTILCDNGGEFNNQRVKETLQKEGIKLRLVCPYTPEQNGCAERENRTVVEAARAMMHAHKQLPEQLWGELVCTAVYILNRTGPTSVEGKVPFELWFGKKASIKHLRIIGSTCYAHVPKQTRKKLQKKAVKGYLIGYDEDGYRIWVTEGKKSRLIRSRDVIFDEKPVASVEDNTNVEAQETTANSNEYTVSLDRIPVVSTELQIESNNESEAHNSNESIELRGEENEIEDLRHEVLQDNLDTIEEPIDEFFDTDEVESVPRYNLRDRSTLHMPSKFEDYAMAVFNNYIPEPLCYQEATTSDNKDKWLEAMKSELSSLHENNTWTLQELPKGRKAIPVKWVYKVKRNPDGTVDRFKARLVVKGYRQKKGMDFEETFSPVARMATIRALISIAASERMHLTQFDVTTAFLNGHLEEEIYIKQPEGFEDGTNKVCKLMKSLYGLKQAPRCWNIRFHEILIELNFAQCTSDPCLYTKKVGDKKILLTLFVDDGLVAASDENLADEFISNLREKLKITTKPANFYLGMEIMQTEGSIILKQEAYTRKLLERFGMAECNPITTPIDKETIDSGKVTESIENNEGKSFPYREAVGALAYLMVATRPDIAYAVSVVSRKLESPTYNDWLKVKRIMRYLKGTMSYGLRYRADYLPGVLESYSDADHGGDCTTGRSTTGVVCRYAGAAISWLSQRQASVALSTTEAELVAASEGAREAVWLKRILKDLTTLECVPTLYVDNEAAVRISHNPELHKRTKHIRIRHFYVRELVSAGEIIVLRISTKCQIADIMTKGLARPTFVPLREELGLMITNKGKY